MAKDWSPDSWRSFPIKQQPQWPDDAELDGERKSFREVGESLRVTAEAARRLVSRAVAGLRDDAERIGNLTTLETGSRRS